MTAVYSLSIPGKSAIEISQDELRTILGEIETELHRSKVYRRALATVKKMFGESSEQASQLFKAVGREAIGLAFHQFAQKQQNVEDAGVGARVNAATEEVGIEANTANDSAEQKVEAEGDLSECLTSVKFHPKTDLQTETVVDTNSSSVEAKNQKKANSPLPWFKNKKTSKAELARVAAAEQRVLTLINIGQQLRIARELKGMTLIQLNIYTHVPVHQMEAIENGKWENLPEEVYVRGFIRVMGNALGLNGTNLAATLPAPEPTKTIAPSWYKEQKSSGSGGAIGLSIKPMHLYVGYTALVAGAVGGLSLMSQQAEAKRLLPDSEASPTSSFNQTSKDKETNTKPGLNSHGQVSVGSQISAPEAL